MCNVLNEDTMTCDYGVSKVLSKDSSVQIMHCKQCTKSKQSVHRQQQNARKVGVMGSRRIFPPSFKLKVLHSYRNDMDCRGNQRATARKYGIHRRQIQKWLQCEESLKNCAENGNTRPASASTTDSSVSVSKSDSATEAAAGPAGPATAVAAAIPAAPALNLNVARLHGDELTTQQKSPPSTSPPHLPRCSTSPPPPPRSIPKNVLERAIPLGYTQYSLSSSRKHLREIETDSTMNPQRSKYTDFQLDFQLNPNYCGDRPKVDMETLCSVDRNDIVTRAHFGEYYWTSTEHQHTANDSDASVHPQPQHHHSPNHYSQSYRGVNLYDRHFYSLIGTPLIKTEPSSPDSMATSGLYESAGSPGGQWAPQSSPVSHQVANNSSGSTLSVHFSSTQGPSYLDTHVHTPAYTRISQDFRTISHPSSGPLITKKEYAKDEQFQKKSTESQLFHTTPHRSSSPLIGELKEYAKEEKKRLECFKMMIKEEVDLPDDEAHDERQKENMSPYIDVTGCDQSTENSGMGSPIVEVERDDLEDSTPSPCDPVNSSRSSNTSSDSEMESLDSAAGNQTSSANLARRQQLRRSFPLIFKIIVLDAFHKDPDVGGNQRATARKFQINRRQVQKWLSKEMKLRDEFALAEDIHREPAPVEEVLIESPIDLTTNNYVSSDHSRPSSGTGIETEYGQSPSYSYEFITSRHRPYYPFTTEPEPLSTTSSCQDLSLRGSYGSMESPSGLYCYSPKDYVESLNHPEEPSVSLKRRSHSWDNPPSPKRFCPSDTSSQNEITQDRPLCLVKPKTAWLMAAQLDALASRLRTESDTSQPSPSTSTRDDGILFKPYLDNPVCRPASNDAVQHDLSPNTRDNIINNNNMNIHNGIKRVIKLSCICNTDDEIDEPYVLRPLLDPLPHMGNTFIRYPFNRFATHYAIRRSCLYNCLRSQYYHETRTTGSHRLANAVIGPAEFVISTDQLSL